MLVTTLLICGAVLCIAIAALFTFQVVNFRSEYQSLERSVFAFVAMESLRDGDEYSSSKPFNPQDKDPNTNEYVPDVGGLAFAYPRAQSPMHWGIFGSLSTLGYAVK